MRGPVTFFHQPEHLRNNHSRGNRGHDCAQNGGFQHRDAKQARRGQDHTGHFEAGGHEAHQCRRTADFFQILKIQRQPRPGQYDNEGKLAQIGGNTEQRAIQQVPYIRPQNDAREEHPQKARQPQPRCKPAQTQTG